MCRGAVPARGDRCDGDLDHLRRHAEHARAAARDDVSGQRQLWSVIGPGQSLGTSTCLTHPWVVTTEGDQCLGVHLPIPGAPGQPSGEDDATRGPFVLRPLSFGPWTSVSLGPWTSVSLGPWTSVSLGPWTSGPGAVSVVRETRAAAGSRRPGCSPSRRRATCRESRRRCAGSRRSSARRRHCSRAWGCSGTG